MGNEYLRGRPDRVPTFPNHLSRGLPSSGRDCRNCSVWLCSFTWGLGQVSPLTSLGYSFIF